MTEIRRAFVLRANSLISLSLCASVSIRFCSCQIVSALCLTILAGCASHTHDVCHDVRGEVLTRTGHEFGPPRAPCSLPVEDLVDWSDGLSEEEAIAVGLWNNPAYQELLADLQIARADVIQAALALLPLVVAGNKPGHEIEYPMALVILGGLLSSTLMNLFVTPALYCALGRVKSNTMLEE